MRLYDQHSTLRLLANPSSYVRAVLFKVLESLMVPGQPPRTQYPERPLPTPVKKPNPHRSTVIPPANYGPVRGAQAAGLQNGTGGKESLNELGLVPQSVLLVKWEDEAMNGALEHFCMVRHAVLMVGLFSFGL